MNKYLLFFNLYNLIFKNFLMEKIEEFLIFNRNFGKEFIRYKIIRSFLKKDFWRKLRVIYKKKINIIQSNINSKKIYCL